MEVVDRGEGVLLFLMLQVDWQDVYHKFDTGQSGFQEQVAWACTSCGIAAQLLTGGSTAHTSKIPLKLHDSEAYMCAIKCGSAVASLLQECALIVWNEPAMVNRLVVETLERTLKDICMKKRLIVGIPLLFLGDFRQTLPVVRFDTRANEIYACFKILILGTMSPH